MRKILFILFVIFTFVSNAQVDYSDAWEDFFSYNNVKDFIKVNGLIYALTDNAVFVYDSNTQETQ